TARGDCGKDHRAARDHASAEVACGAIHEVLYPSGYCSILKVDPNGAPESEEAVRVKNAVNRRSTGTAPQ
ncbi:MAG: hypothetical protein WAU06_04345, partial [Candidatus Nanopelagicales bacterium]